MDVIELIPRLHFLRFPVGHAYLWQDRDGLTLIDAGAPGSASVIADAVRRLGHDLTDLRHLVLTHCHVDHTGAAPGAMIRRVRGGRGVSAAAVMHP